MKIENLKTNAIIPYKNNPRINDDAVDYVANSIRQFGFKVPIVIDKNNVIVTGHTRLKAAKQLGLKEVPCIRADDLTDEQIKAFRIADNKVAEIAEWNDELLLIELDDIDIDMTEFGFDDVFEDEQNETEERAEAKINENISIIIDCKDENEAEFIFNKLQDEGYECRISTL